MANPTAREKPIHPIHGLKLLMAQSPPNACRSQHLHSLPVSLPAPLAQQRPLSVPLHMRGNAKYPHSRLSWWRRLSPRVTARPSSSRDRCFSRALLWGRTGRPSPSNSTAVGRVHAPVTRDVEPPTAGQVIALQRVGKLHHLYSCRLTHTRFRHDRLLEMRLQRSAACTASPDISIRAITHGKARELRLTIVSLRHIRASRAEDQPLAWLRDEQALSKGSPQ